jgi:uncharacterized protein YerC
MALLKETTRKIKGTIPQTMYQLRLYGLFEDEKTRERKDQEGFSKLHSRKDFDFDELLTPIEVELDEKPRRKRDYIGELLNAGYTYKAIAKEAGISYQKLSSDYRRYGGYKSNTEIYEKIRNLSRRAEYQKAREKGMSAAAASKSRRKMFAHHMDLDLTNENTISILQESDAFLEALKHAQWQLGGSNWVLIEILQLEWIKFELS